MFLIGTINSSITGNLSSDTFNSISTVTVGSGGASTITFNSIPATYSHLQIRGVARGSGTTSFGVLMRFNGDTASNYSSHRLDGNGTTATGGANSSVGAMYTNLMMPKSSANSNVFGAAVFDILDYSNVNKFKSVNTIFAFDTNGSGQVGLGSGNWRSTSAISSITLVPESDNFAQYSTFALYGIKAAA
jgi:hypothetical protein